MTKLSSYQKLPTKEEALEVFKYIKKMERKTGDKIHGNQTVAIDMKESDDIEFIAWGKIKEIANAPY